MSRKGNPFALLVGMQTAAATVESTVDIPLKLKMDLPFDPAIPLLGMYSKETKTLIRRNTSTLLDALHIYNCQDMETVQVCISRQVDKTTRGHLHNGILLGHNKEEKFTLCDSMYGPGEHYAK